jgi:hypothetical protein
MVLDIHHLEWRNNIEIAGHVLFEELAFFGNDLSEFPAVEEV